MPKKRYGIMWPHMARVGTLGQRMMTQTATVQVNFDYAGEADAMQKMRVGMGMTPLLTRDVRQLAAVGRRPERLRVVPRPHLDATPTTRAAACCPSSSAPPPASRTTSTTLSTSRCTSSCATATGST